MSRQGVASGRRLRWLAAGGALIVGLASRAVLTPTRMDDDVASAGVRRRKPALKDYHGKIDRLAPFFDPTPKPEEGDWLAKYPEGSQTFDQYVAAKERPVRDDYSEIHVVALSEFTPFQRDLMTRAAELLERFDGLEVRTLAPAPLDDIPPHAQRPRDGGRARQLLTTWLMNDVLKLRRSAKAAALLGFIADDDWGGPDWNWQYGQASLSVRVGVWSIFRNGGPDGDDAEKKLCLVRTTKTTVHERGHMLCIRHCISYSCCMNGSNHREEADRKPLEFCPECHAKIWWTCRVDPHTRYQELITFSDEAGLAEQGAFWQKLDRALSETKSRK